MEVGRGRGRLVREPLEVLRLLADGLAAEAREARRDQPHVLQQLRLARLWAERALRLLGVEVDAALLRLAPHQPAHHQAAQSHAVVLQRHLRSSSTPFRGFYCTLGASTLLFERIVFFPRRRQRCGALGNHFLKGPGSALGFSYLSAQLLNLYTATAHTSQRSIELPL